MIYRSPGFPGKGSLLVTQHQQGFFILYKIRVWLSENRDQINDHADYKQTAGEEIQNSHADFAFVKFVCTEASKEQAEKECNPFVFHSAISVGVGIDICVLVGICVCIVDNYLRLWRLLRF